MPAFDLPAFDLQRFVADCLAAGDDVAAVAECVRAAVADGAAVRAALDGITGDRILYEDARLTVLDVRIPPGFRTAPHDHRMWAVVGIYEGQEDNTFYRADATQAEAIERHAVCAGGVLTMDAEVVHAIANPLAVPTLGLHVYGGALERTERSLWDPFTGERGVYARDRAIAFSRRLAQSGAAR